MNLAEKFSFSTHANQIKRNIKWASYDQRGKKGKYALDLQMRKLMRMEIFASFRNEIILGKKNHFIASEKGYWMEPRFIPRMGQKSHPWFLSGVEIYLMHLHPQNPRLNWAFAQEVKPGKGWEQFSFEKGVSFWLGPLNPSV